MPLPRWVEVLRVAPHWGCAPWEITGDDNRLLWLVRWRHYTEALERAAHDRAVHKNGRRD